MWYNRPRKDIAREKAYSTKVSPNGSTLTLPSDTILDILVGIEKEYVTKKTHFILVERDKNCYKKMVSNAEEHNLNFDSDRCDLVEYNNPSASVNRAYIDLMDCPSIKLLEWVENYLVTVLTDTSSVTFTFTTNPRGNDFVKKQLSAFMMNIDYVALVDTDLFYYKKKESALYFYILRRVLEKHFTITGTDVMEYKDRKAPMVLIKFILNRKGKNKMNTTTKKLTKDQQIVCKAVDTAVAKGTISKGSGAAYKANAVRPNTDLKKMLDDMVERNVLSKRSAGASKANITRL